MQSENKLFDDLARLASGAFGGLSGLRDEIDRVVRDRLERVLARMDLVGREEFEVTREMAANARRDQETLTARVAALEAQLASGAKPKKAKSAAGKGAAGKTRSADSAAEKSAEKPSDKASGTSD